MNCKTLKFKIFDDKRGKLCVMEWSDMPFKPLRSYFLYDVRGVRGAHVHKKEKEVFVCIKGSFRTILHDGKRFKRIVMNKPGQAVYVPNLVWHEFDKFSKNAVLLAFSSIPYKGRKDYITSFKEFLDLCKKY